MFEKNLIVSQPLCHYARVIAKNIVFFGIPSTPIVYISYIKTILQPIHIAGLLVLEGQSLPIALLLWVKSLTWLCESPRQSNAKLFPLGECIVPMCPHVVICLLQPSVQSHMHLSTHVQNVKQYRISLSQHYCQLRNCKCQIGTSLSQLQH